MGWDRMWSATPERVEFETKVARNTVAHYCIPCGCIEIFKTNNQRSATLQQKCNCFIRYRFLVCPQSVTLRSNNDSNIPRAVTNQSDDLKKQ